MASNEQKVEQLAQQIIKIHGFRYNDGFSCLIPDTDKYPSNEGLFLWGFSQKRMRFETKVEKFHTTTRLKRMDEMLCLSEKEYKKVFTAVESYLKSLKAIGFEEIGKGVTLFDRATVFNVQADASMFNNNVEALKTFEEITLNNQVISFAEKQGYFKVQNRDKLAWNAVFKGTSTAKSATRSSKASKSAAKSTKATAAKKPVPKATAAKKPVAPAAKKPAAPAAKKPVAPATKKPAAPVAKKPAAPAAKKPVAKATAAKKPDAPAAKSPAAPVAKTPAAPAAKKPAAPAAKKPAASPSRSQKAAPFGEKLKKLAGSQPISAIDDKTWNKQVTALYKNVRSWLSEHQRSGHLVFNSQTIKLSDPNLGEYDIDSLEMHLAGDFQVVFQPVEMNMPGAAGRVDLYSRGSNTRKVMLLLVNTRGNNFQWEIWKGLNDKGQTFDRGALEALLADWIEA